MSDIVTYTNDSSGIVIDERLNEIEFRKSVEQLAALNTPLASSLATTLQTFGVANPDYQSVLISEVQRLGELLKNPLENPSWLEQYLSLMLEGGNTHGGVCDVLGIHKGSVWRWWWRVNLNHVYSAITKANNQATLDKLEATLYRRALDDNRKDSMTALAMALNGLAPGKYRGQGSSVTVEVNTLPNNLSINGMSSAELWDKPSDH